MPEGYTHVRTAQKAAAAIHYKGAVPRCLCGGRQRAGQFLLL